MKKAIFILMMGILTLGCSNDESIQNEEMTFEIALQKLESGQISEKDFIGFLQDNGYSSDIYFRVDLSSEPTIICDWGSMMNGRHGWIEWNPYYGRYEMTFRTNFGSYTHIILTDASQVAYLCQAM